MGVAVAVAPTASFWSEFFALGYRQEQLPKVEWEIITPDRAGEYLKLKDPAKQRTVSKNRVIMYRYDIENGFWAWQYCPPISLDDTGALLDGQHRLMAIASAGKSIPCLIARNVPWEAFSKIDSGLNRTLNQILGLAGENNTSALGGALRLLVRYRRRVIGGSLRSKSEITRGECLAALSDHPTIRDSVSLLIGKSGFLSPLPWKAAALSFLHYAGSQTSPEEATEYVMRLIDGVGLDKNNPAYVARQASFRLTAGKTYPSGDLLLAMAVKGWRAFEDGRTLSRIPWAPNDPFPAFRWDPATDEDEHDEDDSETL